MKSYASLVVILLMMAQVQLALEKKEITFPSGKVITVEVASKPEERAKGLMFREKLKDNEGMLFIFEQEDFHSFWMKNTLIPLDIIWLDKDRKVVYFWESIAPCKEDPCQSYFPLKKALYVIEVNAGFVKKEELKLGDRVLFN